MLEGVPEVGVRTQRRKRKEASERHVKEPKTTRQQRLGHKDARATQGAPAQVIMGGRKYLAEGFPPKVGVVELSRRKLLPGEAARTVEIAPLMRRSGILGIITDSRRGFDI